MKTLSTFIVLLFISCNLLSQDLDLPANIQLDKVEDYKNSESLFLDATNWLVNTPLSENPQKRREVNGFVMKWLTGSPTVSIELVSGIVPLECADCLMAFMSGWAKHSLENNYSKNKIDGAIAGAENAIEFYTKNKASIGKDADMEKLIKQKDKGKLKKYIKSKF